MSPTPRRSLREMALTVGALLGVLCIVVAVASTFFGVRVLVFRSGSMSPTIETGGAALARPVSASQLKVGDIVSVENAEGVRVTHRVKAIHSHGKTASLTLKGDANQAVDEATPRVTEVDRVFWHVNRLGYVVNALASPYALFAGGAFAALLLFLGFSGGDKSQGSRSAGRRRANKTLGKAPRHSSTPGKRVAVVLGVALSVAMMLLSAVALPTMAGFSDHAAVSTGDFAVKGIPAASGYTCADPVVLSWTHLGPGYKYELRVKNAASEVVNTYSVTTAGAANSTVTYSLPRQSPSSLWTTYHFTVELRTVATTKPVGWMSDPQSKAFSESWALFLFGGRSCG